MFSLVCNRGRVYLSNSIWIWKITVQLHCSCELIAKWMQFYHGWAMQMFFYWRSPDKQSPSECAYVIILIPRAIFSSVCGKKRLGDIHLYWLCQYKPQNRENRQSEGTTHDLYFLTNYIDIHNSRFKLNAW